MTDVTDRNTGKEGIRDQKKNGTRDGSRQSRAFPAKVHDCSIDNNMYSRGQSAFVLCLGLPAEGEITPEMILEGRQQEEKEQTPDAMDM